MSGEKIVLKGTKMVLVFEDLDELFKGLTVEAQVEALKKGKKHKRREGVSYRERRGYGKVADKYFDRRIL